MYIGHKHKWFNESPELLNFTLTYETFHAINKQLLLSGGHSMCTFNKRSRRLNEKTRNQKLRDIDTAVKYAIEPFVVSPTVTTDLSNVIGLPGTDTSCYNNVFELLGNTARDISYHLKNAIIDGFIYVEMTYKFKIGKRHFGVRYQLINIRYKSSPRNEYEHIDRVCNTLAQLELKLGRHFVKAAVDNRTELPYWRTTSTRMGRDGMLNIIRLSSVIIEQK